MDADTWMDSVDAVTRLRRRKVEGERPRPPCLRRRSVQQVAKNRETGRHPEKYRAACRLFSSPDPANRFRLPPPRQTSPRPARRDPRSLDCPRGRTAGELIAAGKTVAEVKKQFEHAQTIRDRCAAAKMPELAANYIKAGLTPDAVSTNLAARKAALDTDPIDNKLGPDGRSNGAPKVASAKEIYALRKQKK